MSRIVWINLVSASTSLELTYDDLGIELDTTQWEDQSSSIEFDPLTVLSRA